MPDMYRIWRESAPGSRARIARELSVGTPLTTGHRVLMAEGWLGLADAGLDRPACA